MAEVRVGAAQREGASRNGFAKARSDGGIHFLPRDGRRFPICGSWRSSWSHTGDADSATCPHCRARLLEPSPGGTGEET